jgi:Zn-dependent M28 family amino/carboxypeptidase
MKHLKVAAYFTSTTLAVAATFLYAQQHSPTSSFDPGIRPATAASIQSEKAAEDAWFAHVMFLASDDLKGRRTGTPDFIHAVEYVESQFKAIGLKPAGTDGFRQSVAFRSATVDVDHSSLELVKSDGQTQKLKIGSEAALSPNTQVAVSVTAPAVFAGYGLVVPGLGLNDLKGIDLHGKIAVIFLAAPSPVHGPLKAYFRTAAARWKTLKAAGAIGLITIPETRQFPVGGARGPSGGRPAADGPRPDQPGETASVAASLTATATGADSQQGGAGRGPGSGRQPGLQLADPALNPLEGAQLSATVPAASAGTLFAGSPHTFEELQALAKNGDPLPAFPLAVNVRATTTTKVISTADAPNVIAELEGSDSKLKHEYLVLSAHLDHLGVGRPVDGDPIYHGAMDNASGIASLIETAKALVNGPRPKRSIVFLALTGEEEGELGSQYFAHYPTVPRAQIIADLNMDMYLPIFPLRFLEVQGLGESTLGNDARAAAQLNDIEVQFDKQPDENRFIRSDQASFVKYGIPSLAFKFGWLPDTPEQKAFNDWIRNRYHHPGDNLTQPIDCEGAVHFDRVLLTLVTRVANAPSRPTWYPESFFSTIPRT